MPKSLIPLPLGDAEGLVIFWLQMWHALSHRRLQWNHFQIAPSVQYPRTVYTDLNGWTYGREAAARPNKMVSCVVDISLFQLCPGNSPTDPDLRI
jgi:hypothetical protein